MGLKSGSMLMANLKELTGIAGYVHEQGLAGRIVDPAEPFHPLVFGEE
jgi:hypothetical protein